MNPPYIQRTSLSLTENPSSAYYGLRPILFFHSKLLRLVLHPPLPYSTNQRFPIKLGINLTPPHLISPHPITIHPSYPPQSLLIRFSIAPSSSDPSSLFLPLSLSLYPSISLPPPSLPSHGIISYLLCLPFPSQTHPQARKED